MVAVIVGHLVIMDQEDTKQPNNAVPQPSQSQREAGVVPTAPVSAPTPGGEFRAVDDKELPRLRTYADDLSDEIKKRGATLTTIVGAERTREIEGLTTPTVGPEETKPFVSRHTLLLVGGAIGLVLLGVAVVVGALYVANLSATPVSTPNSIIFPNKIIPVSATSDRDITDTLASARNNAVLSLGEIGELEVTIDGATTTPQAFLELLGAPNALVRETSGMMLGVHSFDHNQPFLIIQIGQYDRAFAAMLDWEEELGRSLGTFYRPLNGTVPPTTLFTDFVYKNIDIRRSQAAWPILYAFPRRDILVITTNEATLQEITTRLAVQVTPSTAR